ncbi:hypothetical protein GHT06_016082 [Daphnia sinensis]|uniref:Uncharacterized protein n=1 Tax=Daphnia sinensis TaxID=1820382 RepID=A0AAD5LKA2_9CRUS|nr:hypothetical protein GHT06_016082 [Daphnia sinensis]
MSIRICLAAAFLLSVTYGVSSASVAVDLIDTSVKVDNATVVDNSTKSLNMSDSSFIKIRDVIEVAKLGPMCQCLCTNVTDVDVQIKSVPRLDSSIDSASKEGSHFFEVRAVRQVNGSDANVKLVSGNDKLVGNSTDKALNGSESNVTDSATLPPSIVVRDVDVQLVKLDANVSDASAAKSTLNSTDDLAFLRSLEERAVDGSELDEGFLGDTANVSNITSVILELAFDVAPNASQSNVSSLIIERETDEDGQEFDNTGFDESDMDLEGLVLLKDENNSTVNANSTFDLEGSEKASDE